MGSSQQTAGRCARVTALLHRSHTVFTRFKPVRHICPVDIATCGEFRRIQNLNQINPTQIKHETNSQEFITGQVLFIRSHHNGARHHGCLKGCRGPCQSL
jgi:hypothetical protein